MAGWGSGEGGRGRMWEGITIGGGVMGGARAVLTCAPLAHERCNCSRFSIL